MEVSGGIVRKDGRERGVKTYSALSNWSAMLKRLYGLGSRCKAGIEVVVLYGSIGEDVEQVAFPKLVMPRTQNNSHR